MAGTFAPDLLRLGFNVLFFFSFITFLILAGFCGHRFRCRRREKSRIRRRKKDFAHGARDCLS
jgi:hypothetical protein